MQSRIKIQCQFQQVSLIALQLKEELIARRNLPAKYRPFRQTLSSSSGQREEQLFSTCTQSQIFRPSKLWILNIFLVFQWYRYRKNEVTLTKFKVGCPIFQKKSNSQKLFYLLATNDTKSGIYCISHSISSTIIINNALIYESVKYWSFVRYITALY